ncbi:MAG: hypothetical protein KAH38_02835 [Candidatus Hydrogenedentes bacterium]|nr:hypothetical protein [Candidatus Hydrogenedentota bacterium]
MGRGTSKQKFDLANSMYLEGAYEDALALLTELGKEYPGVFNIQLPALKCLQRLGRLEDVKDVHGQMVSLYTREKEQRKLRSVEVWILEQEGGGIEDPLGLQLSADGEDFPGLQLSADGEVLNIAPMDDLFGSSKSKWKSASSSVPVSSTPGISWKTMAAMGMMTLAAVAVYLFLPVLLGRVPEFSADIVLGLPHANLEGKFYRLSADVSRTEIMGQIIIAREGQVYKIIPGEKKYAVMEPSETAGQNPLGEMSDFKKWLDANGGKHTGEEVLYGFECDVYEAKVRMNPAMPPVDTKIWYARDIAFPVKSETIGDGILGKVVMFLKDIQVGLLPADLFEIPSNYVQVAIEEIGGMGMDVGEATLPVMTGNLPDNSSKLSLDDLKRLKNMAQE